MKKKVKKKEKKNEIGGGVFFLWGGWVLVLTHNKLNTVPYIMVQLVTL